MSAKAAGRGAAARAVAGPPSPQTMAARRAAARKEKGREKGKQASGTGGRAPAGERWVVVNAKGVKLRAAAALGSAEVGRLHYGQSCRVRKVVRTAGVVPGTARGGGSSGSARLHVIWPVGMSVCTGRVAPRAAVCLTQHASCEEAPPLALARSRHQRPVKGWCSESLRSGRVLLAREGSEAAAAARGAMEAADTPVRFDCDGDCGFSGSFSEVSSHEMTCPKAAAVLSGTAP